MSPRRVVTIRLTWELTASPEEGTHCTVNAIIYSMYSILCTLCAHSTCNHALKVTRESEYCTRVQQLHSRVQISPYWILIITLAFRAHLTPEAGTQYAVLCWGRTKRKVLFKFFHLKNLTCFKWLANIQCVIPKFSRIATTGLTFYRVPCVQIKICR